MKLTERSIEFIRQRLREGDEEPEEEEEDGPNEEDLDLDEVVDPPVPTDQLTLEDPAEEETENEVMEEGGVPLDSSGVGTVTDALNPDGEVDPTFQSGNLETLNEVPQIVEDKITLVTKTLEPLIEKALIELLGASSMYERLESNNQLSPNEDGSLSIVGTFVFKSQFWIGLDIDQEDIKHDADYVLNTLAPITETVRITECSIDVAEGVLRIAYSA